MAKKAVGKSKAKQYQGDVRVLSTATPEALMKAVLSGAGSIKKSR